MDSPPASHAQPAPKDWPAGFRPEKWLGALVRPETSVLAGVSGGADSVALAILLAELLPRRGYRLEIAHVHHGIRGAEADGDAEFVRDLAASLGVPFHLLRVNAAELMRSGEGDAQTDEGALREARLGLMRATATAIGASAIALAHHRDDQAETFLLMALRGSGPAGLGSMRAVRELPHCDGMLLLRPLLFCARADIERMLTGRGRAWRTDSTNADPRYRRNRLRNEVLPLLASIEPAALQKLSEAALHCAEQAELVAEAARAAAPRVVVAASEDAVLLSCSAMREEAMSLRAEILRQQWLAVASRFAEELALPKLLPTHSLLESVLRRINDRRGDERAFGPHAGVLAIINNGAALLCREGVPVRAAFEGFSRSLPFLVHGEDESPTVLYDGWRPGHGRGEMLELTRGRGRLCYAVTRDSNSALWHDRARRMGNDLGRAIINLDEIELPVLLRAVSPREKFEIGPNSRQMVADLLSERQVMLGLRPHIGAVCDARGILWIPGVRRSYRAYVTPGTRRGLYLSWRSGAR